MAMNDPDKNSSLADGKGLRNLFLGGVCALSDAARLFLNRPGSAAWRPFVSLGTFLGIGFVLPLFLEHYGFRDRDQMVLSWRAYQATFGLFALQVACSLLFHPRHGHSGDVGVGWLGGSFLGELASGAAIAWAAGRWLSPGWGAFLWAGLAARMAEWLLLRYRVARMAQLARDGALIGQQVQQHR